MMSNKATIKITAEVGICCQSHYINTLKTYCFKNDLEIKIEEGKGFLSKPIFVEIKATKDQLEGFKNFFEKFRKDYE